MIRNRVCFVKIMVVLNDVDSYTQFDSLVGPFPFVCGSVVIITMTNENVLVKSGIH